MGTTQAEGDSQRLRLRLSCRAHPGVQALKAPAHTVSVRSETEPWPIELLCSMWARMFYLAPRKDASLMRELIPHSTRRGAGG